VIPDTAVGVNFTAKLTRNIYSFDETNFIFDEDGYSYIGTSDGTYSTTYRMRTPTVSRRDYYETSLSVQRNFAERWQMLSSYAYVISKGTVQDSLGYGLSNPSQVDLMYGNLFTDIRHQFKFLASWDIPDDPWTTRLGVNAFYQTGSPLSRYYYAPAGSIYDQLGTGYGLLKQPLGTYGREEPYYEISMQIEQEIPVKKGKLVTHGEITNLTNATAPYGVDQTYIDVENRYIVYGRQYPIQAQLGLKYEF